jgi:hypothetical protein
MTRPTLVAAVLLATSCLVSTCGKDSPAAPSNQAPAPTRTIRLGGNLNFGNVQVGEVRNDGVLVVTNDGNAVMTVTGMTAPGGVYTATWTSGTISPGATQNVGIHFAPTAAQNYSGVITVNSDQTGGTNTIAVIGVGVGISSPAPAPTPGPSTSCTYTLTPSTLTVGSSGSFAKGTIQVSTTTGCSWTVVIADPWLGSTPMSGSWPLRQRAT